MYANRDIKAYNKAQLSRAASHTFRADPHNDNVDYSRTENNRIVFGSSSLEDYRKALNDKIELTAKARGRAVRKDANLVINQVFHASAEWLFDFKKAGITQTQWQNLDPENSEDVKKIREVWKTLDNEKLEQFQQIVIEHLQACHKHTISLVLHLDEKTPHWHASSVPIVDSEKGPVLSAKQYYKLSTLSAWNKDFEGRINKLGLSFSKPKPDVQLSAEQLSVTEQLSKPEPPRSRRRHAYEPVKKLGVFYTSEDVEKLKRSYESREKNLKEIIENHYKFYDDNAEKIRQFNNLQAKHSVALAELQQLREHKKYTRNYRKLVASEKKMRLEIEQQKTEILELKKEREELLAELHELRPEQKITLQSAHKTIEKAKNYTTLSSNKTRRGYTP